MTARHEISVGGRRLGRDRGAPIDATPAPPVGELLRVARERKGVDIYRAERDTKIRARHLEALETGDYAALPGSVYIKGFLRNYATYLGLDPEEVLDRWRDETTVTRHVAEPAVPVAPPRPISQPRGGVTFSPQLLIYGVVAIVAIAFFGYMAAQVMRFNQQTPIAVDGPRLVTLAMDAEEHTFGGTAQPLATIVVTGPSDYLGTTEADAEGAWSLSVPVDQGENEFRIIARDPDTQRESQPVSVLVTVPVPATPSPSGGGGSPSPGGSSTLPPVPPAQLVLTSPVDGAVLDGSTVTVSGTTDGTSVEVSAAWVGPTPATSPSPGASASPDAGPTATAAPSGSAVPPPVDPTPITVAPTDGAFSAELTLGPGRWTVTVRATLEGRDDGVVTRTVDIGSAGLVVTIAVPSDADCRRECVWLLPKADGRRISGWPQILPRGATTVLDADESLEIRTGNAGLTVLTVNGEELGPLGRVGFPGTWLIEAGEAPRQIE